MGEEELGIAYEPSPSGLLDDFETMDDYWWGESDDTGSILECTRVSDPAYSGHGSMQIQYQIIAGGWGGCWRSFEGPQNWSEGAGLTLWLNSERSEQRINVDVFLGDPGDPTPFITTIELPDTGWTQVVIPWADFERAAWASESGPQTFDPAQVVSYGFGLGSEEAQIENMLWVDGVTLSTSSAEPSSEEETVEDTPQLEPHSEVTDSQESEAEEPERSFPRSLCPSSSTLLPLATVFLLLRRRRRLF
jgi:hypothetical protein